MLKKFKKNLKQFSEYQLSKSQLYLIVDVILIARSFQYIIHLSKPLERKRGRNGYEAIGASFNGV
jgi:hypothetical protein